MVPVTIGWMFHQQEHPVPENNLEILHVVCLSVLVLEDKVPLCTKGETSNRCFLVQLSLVIFVVSHFVIAVFVSVDQDKVVPTIESYHDIYQDMYPT